MELGLGLGLGLGLRVRVRVFGSVLWFDEEYSNVVGSGVLCITYLSLRLASGWRGAVGVEDIK